MELFDTTIVCIRHGESEANVYLHKKDFKNQSENTIRELIKSAGVDPNLTEKGLEQAKATAIHLDPVIRKVVDTDHVMLFTSTLKRAQQTAAAFQQNDLQPLYVTKMQVLPEMKEFNREEYPDVTVFVDQIFKLFDLLKHKAEMAIEPQTIFLVGHSLAFSTLLTIISFHRKNIDRETHRRLVLDRVLDLEKPKRLNNVFEIPNCSISIIQGRLEAIPRQDNPKKSNIIVDWRILGIGKVEHLNQLRTGTHSAF